MNVPAYSLIADPYFTADAASHLSADFGDAYAMHVEPHDNGYHCHIGSAALGADKPIFATFKAIDQRDVLALAVALDNTARMEEGELLDDAPFNGFVLHGQHIHNPFADPEYGQWVFSSQPELRHPREQYGAAYEMWRDMLAEERARQIDHDDIDRTHAERIEQERQAGRGWKL